MPLVLALFGASGCVMGYQLGAVSTVDTAGDVGLAAAPGFSQGLALDDDSAVLFVFDGRLGGVPTASKGLLGISGGLDFHHQQLFGKGLGLRAGTRSGVLAPFDCDGFDMPVTLLGGEVALLLLLDDDHYSGHEKWGGGGDSYWNLAVSLGAAYVMSTDEEGPRALLTLGVAYELDGFSELF
ncbi:MAG: hypothetical protein RBU45_19045 [Myxococcota bacterium]|jgi:hypothetical protein|nr:hypothetical protein [Myxococcota bacterium]